MGKIGAEKKRTNEGKPKSDVIGGRLKDAQKTSFFLPTLRIPVAPPSIRQLEKLWKLFILAAVSYDDLNIKYIVFLYA